MRYDPPPEGPAYEVRAVTISWARAMWVGFWFALGVATAAALPAIGMAVAIAAIVGSSD